MNPDQLDPPNFKGGPKMCRAANLPAFETPRAAENYFDTLPSWGEAGEVAKAKAKELGFRVDYYPLNYE